MNTEHAGFSEVVQLFIELCEIPSPSYHEGEIARRIRTELAELGCEVSEDGAAERLGAGCGNILGRLPATTAGIPIVLCAHLDTVPVADQIEVVVEDGIAKNRHDAILGGDDKAAVAAMLVGVRNIVRERLPHAGIELLFTPCEEVGLRGAACVDVDALVGKMGFVYDHTGPIGQIVTSAPWHSRINATMCGTAAHAGMRPEDGRSAIHAAAAAIARMPLGRIDPETTANVGVISGGHATNVVAARCDVIAEARSRSQERLGQQVTAMIDALTAAAIDAGCELECQVTPEYHGYSLTADAPQLRLAERALTREGFAVSHIAAGGGSDVNALLENGFPSVNLCNAMTDVHTSNESIAIADIEAMERVTRALIAEAVGAQ